MSLADAWYEDPTLNTSYALQYAQELENSGSGDLANVLRQTGDVVGILGQQLLRYQQQRLDSTLIQQQIDRARAGLPPVAMTPSTGMVGQFGGAVNWQMIGLLALGAGAIFMLSKRKR
jgi:hypothetical protein